MAKSINQAFKKNKSDELYTPRILVEILKPFFDKWILNFLEDYYRYNDHQRTKPITIWFPFDTEKSEFVSFFNEKYPSVRLEISHISTGQDFFKYEPKHWDIAISNPPFSKKLDVYKRLNSFKKPWVMLGNMMQINYMEIGNYFADNSIQMIIPDKRVSFDGNPSSFCSGYFCKDFLQGSNLEFVHLPHCNSGINYIPSRMYNN